MRSMYRERDIAFALLSLCQLNLCLNDCTYRQTFPTTWYSLHGFPILHIYSCEILTGSPVTSNLGGLQRIGQFWPENA